MAEKTGISWTDHTFNPWWGCTKISAGCNYCYAARDSKRYGFDIFGPAAGRRFFGEKHWNEPFKWNAEAAKVLQRRKCFVASMADVAEVHMDTDVNATMNRYRMQFWAMVEACKWLDFLIVTKRPENLLLLTPEIWSGGWPDNAWAITTVENQANARRIEHLRQIPAKVRGLSIEPMLGPVDFSLVDVTGIHWAIYGAESAQHKKPGRPCENAWIRQGLEQCRARGIAAFVKQIHIDGRLTHEPSEWPADLRVREFPNPERTAQ